MENCTVLILRLEWGQVTTTVSRIKDWTAAYLYKITHSII